MVEKIECKVRDYDEQDIKDLRTYAKKIKKYCQNNTNCDECCFYREDKCVISYQVAETYEYDYGDGYTDYDYILRECTPKEWKI